jgi:hypothetical protein
MGRDPIDLPSFLAFTEINANSLKLVIVVTNVLSGGVNAVLSRHDLQKDSKTYHTLST